MSKNSLTLVAVLLAGLVGFVAYDPSAAKSAVNWLRCQVGFTEAELKQPISSPNYLPVVPGNGL